MSFAVRTNSQQVIEELPLTLTQIPRRFLNEEAA